MLKNDILYLKLQSTYLWILYMYSNEEVMYRSNKIMKGNNDTMMTGVKSHQSHKV